MPTPNAATAAVSPGLTPGCQVARYWLDALWRAAATADTLRERAANMSAHEAAGMPPLLHFEAEPVADGREFEPPSNYRLLHVTRCGTDALEKHVRKGAAPVIVVGPRAGHGQASAAERFLPAGPRGDAGHRGGPVRRQPARRR